MGSSGRGCVSQPNPTQVHRDDRLLHHQQGHDLQDFCDARTLGGDWRPLADSIRESLDGYRGRLGVHGPFKSLPLNAEDPDVRQVVNRRLHQALDVCEYLGATQLVVHSPYTAWNHHNFPAKSGARERHAERIHRAISDVVQRAEGMGCVIVVENVEDKDPEERVKLVRSFESSAIRTSLDTGHAHYSHHSADAPSLLVFIAAAADTLAHVHLQDTNGDADWHWHPGQGSIPWTAAFSAFEELSQQPRLLLEVQDKRKLLEGADFLVREGLAV